MATPNIVPRTEGEGGIGTAAKGWGKLFITNKTASSATEGGNITLAANDGAAMASGHRLGVVEFKGAEDGSGTLTTGARIEAVTDALWSDSENGANLVIYTTDGNAVQSRNVTFANNLQASFAGPVLVTGSVTGLNYRTIYVDAGSMVPTVTNGAQAATEEMHATNFTTMDYFAFDKATEEYVDFKMVMPEQYDNGQIRAKFYWKPSDAEGSVSVIWGIKAYAAANDDTLAPGSNVWGTEVEIEDVSLNADNDLHISDTTAAMTIAGTPVAGKLIFFRVYRKAADGTDDYDADAHLLGVNIQYRETSAAQSVWS